MIEPALLAVFLLLPASAARGAEFFSLPKAPVSDPIRYQADHFEYQGSTTGADATILLRGNVSVVQSSWSLRAAEATLDMRTRVCRASGGFELDNGLQVLRGESGRFDFARRVGVVETVRAEYPPWRIWGREGSLEEGRTSRFRKAVFTSCDGNPPDYHFRASTLRVKPKKWLYATNVRLYIWKIPVFYSPFLWKSLAPEHLIRTKMSFSVGNRNGGAARSTTEFHPLKSLYGKLFVDYYTRRGVAAGSELNLHASEDSRGALYAYGIDENGGGEQRWTLLGNWYQASGSTWSVQGRLQAQSDPEVNNDYVRSNAFRVTAELVNGGAVVRQTRLTTTRISYSRLDARADVPLGGGALQTGRRFLRQRESLPRLDWRTAELKIPRVPVLFTLNAFGDNSFDRARGFQQKSAGTGVEATQTINIFRGLSLTPRAAFREVFEDKREVATSFASSATLKDVFTGFYTLGANLRIDTPFGDWDAGYSFERRLRPDSFENDAGAPDYGIEFSRVTLQNTMRPNRRVLFRVGGGYDFRRFRSRLIGFRERVEPITADLVLFPARGISVSLRNDYQIETGNRSFLLQADWGERDATFAGFGVLTSRDRPGEFFSGLEAGWAPQGSSWRFGGALRSSVLTPGGFDFRAFRLYEKELSVTKNFHDFHTRILMRLRPGGVQEYLFRIDLRTDWRRLARKARKRKDWEKEWFPWRSGEKTDRE